MITDRKELQSNVTTIIYGAGDYGQKLLRFMTDMAVKVDYICQSEAEESACLNGIPILSVQQLRLQSGRKRIFIAIMDSDTSRLIQMQLLNLLSEEDEIYECGGFIRQNMTVKADPPRKCNICGRLSGGFRRGGNDYEIFRRHHIIGGGPRENCICPVCGSTDRERWCLYVMKRYTHILDGECRVLHIAPEQGISARIRANHSADYYCGDIDAARYGYVHTVDVTNMCQFRDGSFDYIIINHVLEHIPDLAAAVSELKRLLKEEGRIIMSFPICTDQQTVEETEPMTAAERIRLFAQEDHVRLFGSDYKERIEQYGLRVTVLSPQEEYSAEQIEYYGLLKDDVILLCEKL